MPHRNPQQFELTSRPVRPWRLFALILLLVFTVEYVVMLVLPRLVSSPATMADVAIVDSIGLSIFMAPAIWALVVVPLRRLSESRRLLLRRAFMAQEDERKRIARDLHDGIGQSLTSLMLRVRVIEEISADPAIKLQAREVREFGAAVHAEVRQLVRGLRPMMLEHAGLAAALTQMVEEIGTASAPIIHLETDDFRATPLTPELETMLYRIAQEAVSNAIQHAASTQIVIRLATAPLEVLLEIEDNGRGFDVAAALRRGPESSFGLLSMRERVVAHAGTIRIQSEPGRGTSISLRVPRPNPGVAS